VRQRPEKVCYNVNAVSWRSFFFKENSVKKQEYICNLFHREVEFGTKMCDLDFVTFELAFIFIKKLFTDLSLLNLI
jgi:hypothetical protein